MTVTVVYRSYGGENMKNRPHYYSKRMSLLSAIRAADEAGCEMLFLNDGPVPEHRLSLMRGRGRIIELPGVGMRRSYVAGLRLPARLGRPDDDVVWFSEDDYLYTPDAFSRLADAARDLDADYFALYADIPCHRVNPGRDPDWVPRGWDPGAVRTAGGHEWVRALSTASSFGVRCGALREDLPIFLQGLLPHRHMYRDHDTCVVYQGHEPHSWQGLARDLTGRSPGSAGDRLREAALVPFKAALNIRSHRRPSRRRTMLAAAPNLATHLEIEWMSPGRDWEVVARETLDRAGRGADDRTHSA